MPCNTLQCFPQFSNSCPLRHMHPIPVPRVFCAPLECPCGVVSLASPNLHHAHCAKSQSPHICTPAQQPSSHGWCTIMCPPYTFPSTSGNIPHCTHTCTHALSLAALPHLDMPVHPCFQCLEDFSPQTSPSGTIYPMVGVPSMCPPHPFSHFPTSRHPCGPAFLPTWCQSACKQTGSGRSLLGN